MDTNKENIAEYDLTIKGYELINSQNYDKAIDLFKLLVYALPNSYDAFDSLAEAYMKNESHY